MKKKGSQQNQKGENNDCFYYIKRIFNFVFSPVTWFYRLQPIDKFTAVLCVVGIITAVILYETDQTSRLRDRAFLYFNSNVERIPYPPNSPKWWGTVVSGTNAGNMAARRVQLRFACPFIDKEKPDLTFKEVDCELVKHSTVVGPKQTFSFQGCEIQLANVEKAKSGDGRIFVFLEATYLDGFYLDTPRRTEMTLRFYFDQWGGQSLGFYGPHNCTDEDCPK